MQGWRMSMEDEHICCLELKPNMTTTTDFKDHVAFYAVFDGHGGSSIAEFSGDNVAKILSKEEAFLKQDYVQSLIDCFLHTDEEILKDQILKMDHSGCTATTILISKLQNRIICANSGDSRTVLSSSGLAKNLSYDHKPTNAGERARIYNAGGFVEMSRVNGNLALSRAIGDFEFKQNADLPPEEQIVTVYPDILEHSINPEQDEFVILACDGIWDCLSSQECVDLIHYGIVYDDSLKSLEDISSKIVDVCCSPDAGGQGIGCDNMSMMIVALLKDGESVDAWFTRIKEKHFNGTSDSDELKQRILPDGTSFVNARKKIFSYYDFEDEDDEENDESTVFQITNPKNDASGNIGGLCRGSNAGLFSSNRRAILEDDDEEEDKKAVSTVKGSKYGSKDGKTKTKGEEDEEEEEEEEDDEANEHSPFTRSNDGKIVLNLDDFLQQNGSLTRDENGMTYIQGHLLSEVLESLVGGTASGKDKVAEKPGQETEEDKSKSKIEEIKEDGDK
ncbi:type 2C protein phosphatase PTC2 SCDLUD_000200 [Saccharomycodes ludwigii]|nr:hypothetical protein SCDLUD_000200 [Saccharomycodes ludwigii]KAH3902620.1 hypothetical protein SCDLUD_000200 [Saccharomycodes ludwigii]